MRIISEKTKKEYKTVEECLAAEKEYDELQAKKREEAEKRAAERKERAKEVEDAYKAAKEAENRYVELRNQFVRDYGSFHMTYSNVDKPEDLKRIDDLFRMFFF